MDPTYPGIESNTRRRYIGGGLRKRITYPLCDKKITYPPPHPPWTFGGSVNLPPIHHKHPRSQDHYDDEIPDFIRRKAEEKGSNELYLTSKFSTLNLNANHSDNNKDTDATSSSSNEIISCTVKPIHCWLNTDTDVTKFAQSWPLSRSSSGGTQTLKLPQLVNCGEPRRRKNKKQKSRRFDDIPHQESKSCSQLKMNPTHRHRQHEDGQHRGSYESQSSKSFTWLQQYTDDVDDVITPQKDDHVILPNLLLS